MSNFRNESRKDWDSSGLSYSDAQLSLGCLQRIADASEAMAKNWNQLSNERDMYKRWYQERKADCEERDRRIAALRGTITKLKKAISVKQDKAA